MQFLSNPTWNKLCIGRDSGDHVNQEYKSPGAFTGGKIVGGEVNMPSLAKNV